MLSEIDIMVMVVSTFVIAIVAKRWTREIYPYLLRKEIRKTLSIAFVINAIFYALIVFLFLKIYGSIADDLTYYGGDVPVTGNILTIQNGTQLLQIFAGYLRIAIGLDLLGFHILFAAIGFIGSLLFFRTLFLHIIISKPYMIKHMRLALWSVMCFPNIIAWGRFFGKDTLMFTLAAFWIYNSHCIVFQKMKCSNLVGLLISGFLMYIVRPHIAMSMLLALLFAIMIKLQRTRIKNTALNGIVKIFGPYLFVGISILGVYHASTKIVSSKVVNTGNVQSSLTDAATTGAYGGSARVMVDDENTGGAFSPQKILTNIGYLYFAPFPWQMRGAIDGIALFSNMLLLYLLWKYIWKIDRKSLWHIYMLAVIGMFTLLLSFMTGNVGLILREKTILLPFVFLLLFSNSDQAQNLLIADKKLKNKILAVQ